MRFNRYGCHIQCYSWAPSLQLREEAEEEGSHVNRVVGKFSLKFRDEKILCENVEDSEKLSPRCTVTIDERHPTSHHMQICSFSSLPGCRLSARAND